MRAIQLMESNVELKDDVQTLKILQLTPHYS